MKPGEFVSADGWLLRETRITATWETEEQDHTVHINPGHPDFPAAVAALQSLIPEKEPFWWEWELDGARFRWDGKNIQSQTCHEDEWRPCIDGILAAFEAGRCYQRERGDE